MGMYPRFVYLRAGLELVGLLLRALRWLLTR